jgi:predicted XRE-type DNA-binding protein
MKKKSFSSVWDALEDSPAEAANMKMRSSLMIAIREEVRAWKLTQANAAKHLDLTQPRLNDLLKGRIDNFSVDALVNIAKAAGLKVEIRIADAA